MPAVTNTTPSSLRIIFGVACFAPRQEPVQPPASTGITSGNKAGSIPFPRRRHPRSPVREFKAISAAEIPAVPLAPFPAEERQQRREINTAAAGKTGERAKDDSDDRRHRP